MDILQQVYLKAQAYAWYKSFKTVVKWLVICSVLVVHQLLQVTKASIKWTKYHQSIPPILKCMYTQKSIAHHFLLQVACDCIFHATHHNGYKSMRYNCLCVILLHTWLVSTKFELMPHKRTIKEIFSVFFDDRVVFYFGFRHNGQIVNKEY